MESLPHNYKIKAISTSTGNITLIADNKPELLSAPPKEFDGPGDLWSPEDLLVAAVADCFILSFKAIAKASRVSWNSISCEASGILDKEGRSLQFTSFEVNVKLDIPSIEDHEKAARALQKAEKSCLITNSLKADCHLKYEIINEQT